MSGPYYQDEYGGQYFVGTSDRGWTFFRMPRGGGGRILKHPAKPWADRAEAVRRLKEFARLRQMNEIERLAL